MAPKAIGYRDGGSGSFGFKFTDDGRTYLGNTLDDILSITGSIQQTAGSSTFCSVTITGSTIGHTSDTDLITLADGNVTIAGTLVLNQHITHNGDADTRMNFTDNRIQFEAGGITLLGLHKKSSAPHQVTVNNGNNNIDFVVNSNNNSNDPILRTDASTARVGIRKADPDCELDVDGTVTATSFVGTLATAAQGNITSLGTLTGVTCSGLIAGNQLKLNASAGDIQDSQGHSRISWASNTDATVLSDPAGGAEVTIYDGQVTVSGDLHVNDYARIDALRVGTTSTDPGDGNLYVEEDVTAAGDIYVDVIRRQSDSSTTTKIRLMDEEVRIHAGNANDEVLKANASAITVNSLTGSESGRFGTLQIGTASRSGNEKVRIAGAADAYNTLVVWGADETTEYVSLGINADGDPAVVGGYNGTSATSNLAFMTQTGGGSNESTKMLLTSDGKLGIGKNDPTVALAIGGDFGLSDSSTINRVTLEAGTGADAFFGFGEDSNERGWIGWDAGDQKITLGSISDNGTFNDTLVVNDAKVGIGTTTPFANLSIEGDADGGTVSIRLGADNSSASNFSGRLEFAEDTNGSQVMTYGAFMDYDGDAASGFGNGMLNIGVRSNSTTDTNVLRIDRDALANSIHIHGAGTALGTTDKISNERLHVRNTSSGYGTGLLLSKGSSTGDEYLSLDISATDTATITAGAVGAGDCALTFRTSDSTEYERMRIDKYGHVLINATSSNTSEGLLQIKQSSNDNNGGGISIIQSSTDQCWTIWQGSDENLYFTFDDSTKGYLHDTTNVGAIDFTGQHRSTPSSESSYSELSSSVGKIVVSDGTYSNLSAGSIDVNEAIPKVKLSNSRNQKSVFGVVSDAEEQTSSRVYSNGAFASVFDKGDENDHRIIINSLGEGGIWIANIGGNIENGDYITTCEIPGYGMKQDDDLLHNYTVAKITQDCLFDLNSTTYECEEVQHNGQTYKAAFVGCTYHCG